MNSGARAQRMNAMDRSAPGSPHRDQVSLKKLRAAIPSYCFESSTTTSLLYIARDITISSVLFYSTTYISLVPILLLRQICWLFYGFAQGLVFTGLWIQAHECGHQALFKRQLTNDGIGLILHSLLLVPYFSWKYSHARHHRYTNHIEKDTAFVPAIESETRIPQVVARLFDISEDTPVLNLVLLILHQLGGFPLYLLTHVTAGKKSSADGRESQGLWTWCNNHFNPWSDFFSKSNYLSILISDLGILAMVLVLQRACVTYGIKSVFLTYGIPYLWVNHWIVAITYLHHNHHSVNHFGDTAWNFELGALSTVDRDFGFIGRHLFHGIIEWHVIHHLFSKIPFYHAEEATEAIRPLLKDRYIRDETPILQSLWTSFTALQYVIPQKPGSQVFVWAWNMGYL